jgi:hypothetical protein
MNISTAETVAELRPAHYLLSEAPRDMVIAAKKYEERFHIEFASLTYFSRSLLDELHQPANGLTLAPSRVTIASHADKTILEDIEILSQIANHTQPTIPMRKSYFSALKSIYSKLPARPDEDSRDEHTLCVGIEREGRILAESMHWLPPSHSLNPHAKRIPYEDGLVIGLNEFPLLPPYTSCIIIDGAIASGTTIISVIEKLRSVTSCFYIYSVHSTYEGIRAITRYCLSARLKLKITVGHATSGISNKFYAVDPTSTKRLVVGDLGDTISDL